MRRDEQFRRSRAWLKTHSFVVTNSLRKKLESIPREDWEGHCYVQNLVLIFAAQYEKDFASIPSAFWKDKLGTTYTAVIRQLKDWNELEVDEDFRWSKDKSGYPMSYAVPDPAMETGTCIIDFERKRVRLPRPKNKPTDAESEYALECLSKLRVAGTLTFPPPKNPSKNPDVRRATIRLHCEHIVAGDFFLHYGPNVKRLYHRVLMMPKEGRCNLTYCYPLAEYDVRTCHPLLMLRFFTAPVERTKYVAMLSGDIYSRIQQEMKIADREQVKKDFQRAVNPRRKTANWMSKQYVFQFYHHHFPTFAEQVLFNRTDLAASLQNLEASLMVQKLGEFCRDKDLFWIPMHDGFIARMDQGSVIAAEAVRLVKNAVGLAPKIECTPVGTVTI